MHQGMVHDPDAIQRFNREASNASQIQHPNVAAIYDFGETPEGLIYLAMEFVDGEPLTKIIERHGALTAARAAEIGQQVAVRARGRARHGDRPSRSQARQHHDRPRPRTAKMSSRSWTSASRRPCRATIRRSRRPGLAIGTPEYMSPEQLGGDTARLAHRHLLARPRDLQHAHGATPLPIRRVARGAHHAPHREAAHAGRDQERRAVAARSCRR